MPRPGILSPLPHPAGDFTKIASPLSLSSHDGIHCTFELAWQFKEQQEADHWIISAAQWPNS